MSILRFANPGSDTGRMLHSFRLVADAAHNSSGQQIDLDGIAAALVHAGQASSSGTVGAEALKRSTRADRSLDALFNQSKMYSELWRMLGWLWSAGRRSVFQTTPLGFALADNIRREGVNQITRALLRYSLLGITVPSPHTAVAGVINNRPFPLFLRLMDDLDGWMSRDELIIGVLGTTDDRDTDVIRDTVSRLRSLRAEKGATASAVMELAEQRNVQCNTLYNYTRFPLGAVSARDVGWATAARTRIHGQPLIVRRLSSGGRTALSKLRLQRDIRENELRAFPSAARAHFVNYTFYCALEEAGYDSALFSAERQTARQGCDIIVEGLGIGDAGSFLYSSVQQADPDIIKAAIELERPQQRQ